MECFLWRFYTQCDNSARESFQKHSKTVKKISFSCLFSIFFQGRKREKCNTILEVMKMTKKKRMEKKKDTLSGSDLYNIRQNAEYSDSGKAAPFAPSGPVWRPLWKRPTARSPRASAGGWRAVCGCAERVPMSDGTAYCTAGSPKRSSETSSKQTDDMDRRVCEGQCPPQAFFTQTRRGKWQTAALNRQLDGVLSGKIDLVGWCFCRK